LKQLLDEGVFTRYVILHRRKGAPASYRILDSQGKPLELYPAHKG